MEHHMIEANFTKKMDKTIKHKINKLFSILFLRLSYSILDIFLLFVIRCLLFSGCILIAYFELMYLAVFILFVMFLLAKSHIIYPIYIYYYHWIPLLITFSGSLVFCSMLIFNILLIIINVIIAIIMFSFNVLHIESAIIFLTNNTLGLLCPQTYHINNHVLLWDHLFLNIVEGDDIMEKKLYTTIGKRTYSDGVNTQPIVYREFSIVKNQEPTQIKFDHLVHITNPKALLNEYGPRFRLGNLLSQSDVDMYKFLQDVFHKYTYGGPLTRVSMVLLSIEKYPNISIPLLSEMANKYYISALDKTQLLGLEADQLYNLVGELRDSIVVRDIFGDPKLDKKPDSRGFFETVFNFFDYVFHYFFPEQIIKQEQKYNKFQDLAEYETFIFRNRLRDLTYFRSYLDSIKSTLYSIDIKPVLEAVSLTHANKNKAPDDIKIPEYFLLNSTEFRECVKLISALNSFQTNVRIDHAYLTTLLLEVGGSQGCLISPETIERINALEALKPLERLEHMELYNEDINKILYIDRGFMYSIKKE